MNTPAKPHRYIVIKKYLQDQIEDGSLLPGQQIPTELELMEKFHVSRVTAANAIKQLVEEGILYRVAGKGTFLKETPAARMLEGIGLVMPAMSDPMLHELLHAIERACRSNGVLLTIYLTDNDMEEREGIQQLIDGGVSGLLIFPFGKEVYSPSILQLITSRFPFVLLDKYVPGLQTNAVYSDNRQGGSMGTAYLVGKGHRLIGIVSSAMSQTSSAEDRFLGFLDSARACKLTLQPEHWLTRIHDQKLDSAEDVHRIIHSWLDELADVTAIFSFDRYDAIQIAKHYHEKGKRIPEDVAILTFDDPEYRDYEGPLISYLHQNVAVIGQSAVELLLRVIADPSVNEQIRVPVALVEGRST